MENPYNKRQTNRANFVDTGIKPAMRKPLIWKSGALLILTLIVLSVFYGCDRKEGPQTGLYRQFIVTKQPDTNTTGTLYEDLSPELKNRGKFKIAVLESGVWSGFTLYLDAAIKTLTDLGWGDRDVYHSLSAQEKASTLTLIKALNEKGWSEYIEFAIDSYSRIQIETRNSDALKIYSRQDLDLIIGLGTWAGQDLKKLPDDFKTPCIIMAVSKPIKAGIIVSATDSGRKNFTGRIDPDRFKRQVRLFHSIINYKKLGVVYAGGDSEAAMYAAIPDINSVRAELRKDRGDSFDLISATHVPASGDMNLINRMFFKNIGKIAPKIDAFYLTLQNGVNDKTLPGLVELFLEHKIPTFYMGSTKYVKRGIMLGFTADYDSIGQFNAEKVIRILKGAKPQDLNMIYEAKPRIAVNLATAKLIGFDLPTDVLKIADEIYTSIE